MDAAGEPAPQEEYPSSAVLGAALATLFIPLISLILALVLGGQQVNERKRAQLRTWAWASAGWIAFQILVGIIFFVAVSSGSSVDRSGPCVGGPELGATGRDTGDGEHFVLPCVGGGTVTVRVP
jgi:hypothetical protein